MRQLRTALLAASAAMAIAAPAPVRAETVKTGGTLNVISYLVNFETMNFDPTAWTWKTNSDHMGMESLLRGNLALGPGGSNAYNFKPGDFMPLSVLEGSLAESYKILRDPLRIEFKLRRDVNWMPIEGVMEARSLVANDVVESFNARAKSQAAIKDFWQFVDRWEAPDERTVVAYLHHFRGDWDYLVTWGYYDGVIPTERLALAPERRSDWRKLGGSGPFRLADMRQGQRQVYEKNPAYWDSVKIDGKSHRLPLTDRVVLHQIREEAAAIAALTSGQVDVMESVRWQFVDQLKSSAPKLHLQKYNQYSGTYIALRVDKAPFK